MEFPDFKSLPVIKNYFERKAETKAAKQQGPGAEYALTKAGQKNKAVGFTNATKFEEWFSDISTGASMRKLVDKVEKRTEERYFKKHDLSLEEQLATYENLSDALENAIKGRNQLLAKLKQESTITQIRKLTIRMWSFTNPERMETNVKNAEVKLNEMRKKIDVLKQEIASRQRAQDARGTTAQKVQPSIHLSSHMTDTAILEHFKEMLKLVENKSGKLRLANDGSLYHEPSKSYDAEWVTQKGYDLLSSVGRSPESAETLMAMISELERIIISKPPPVIMIKVRETLEMLKNKENENWWLTGILKNNKRKDEIQSRLDRLYDTAKPATRETTMANPAGDAIEISTTQFIDYLFDPKYATDPRYARSIESWQMTMPWALKSPALFATVGTKIDQLNDALSKASTLEERNKIFKQLAYIESVLVKLEKSIDPKDFRDKTTQGQLYLTLFKLYEGGYISSDHKALRAYNKHFDTKEIISRITDDFVQVDRAALTQRTRQVKQDPQAIKNQKIALLNFCKIWVANDISHKSDYAEQIANLRRLAQSDSSEEIRANEKSMRLKPMPSAPVTQEGEFDIKSLPRVSLSAKMTDLLRLKETNASEYKKALQALSDNITMEHAYFFSKIEPSALLKAGWTDKANAERSASLSTMTNGFTSLQNSIILNILKPDLTIKQRGELVATYLELAEQLYNTGNFFGAQAIISALSHSKIARLNDVWNYLNPQQNKKFKDFEEVIFSQSQAGANIRDQEKRFQGKLCIPSINFHQTVLTMANEATPYVFNQKNNTTSLANAYKIGLPLTHLMEMKKNVSIDPNKITFTTSEIWDAKAVKEEAARQHALTNMDSHQQLHNIKKDDELLETIFFDLSRSIAPQRQRQMAPPPPVKPEKR